MSDIPGIRNDGNFRKIMDMVVEYGYGTVTLIVKDHKVFAIVPGPSIRSGTIDLANLHDIVALTLKSTNPRSATGGNYYIPKDR